MDWTLFQLACIAVLAFAYGLLTWQTPRGERGHLWMLVLLIAAGAWLGEETSILRYRFYGYPDSWWLKLDEVPFLVVAIWPLVVLTADQVIRALWPGLSRITHAAAIAAMVFVDASLVETVAVAADLWWWVEGGYLGAPLIGLVGWAAYAFSIALFLPGRPRRAAPTEQEPTGRPPSAAPTEQEPTGRPPSAAPTELEPTGRPPSAAPTELEPIGWSQRAAPTEQEPVRSSESHAQGPRRAAPTEQEPVRLIVRVERWLEETSARALGVRGGVAQKVSALTVTLLVSLAVTHGLLVITWWAFFRHALRGALPEELAYGAVALGAIGAVWLWRRGRRMPLSVAGPRALATSVFVVLLVLYADGPPLYLHFMAVALPYLAILELAGKRSRPIE